MNQKIDLLFRSLLMVFLTLGLASCNLYSKFGSSGSDEGKIEEALKCLHDGDYACAIANYSALADATEKARRLCQVNLARAGLTLPVLINELGSGTDSATALGDLATAILPWTQEKQTAIEDAASPCDTYYAADTASQYGKVLSTLSGLMDCAVRLAKTDQFVAKSDGDTECTTAGNGDSKITAADVSDQSNGTITTGGMCTSDATVCKNRISATSGSSGGDQNLDALISQLTGLTGVSTGDAIRNILRTKVAP